MFGHFSGVHPGEKAVDRENGNVVGKGVQSGTELRTGQRTQGGEQRLSGQPGSWAGPLNKCQAWCLGAEPWAEGKLRAELQGSGSLAAWGQARGDQGGSRAASRKVRRPGPWGRHLRTTPGPGETEHPQLNERVWKQNVV